MTGAETCANAAVPLVSVIIPVLHEAAGINACIVSLREAAGTCPIEIIVVDGDRSDSTISVITDRSVRTCRSEPGRGRQMNQGAGDACGAILLFLHADTRLPDRAIEEIIGSLSGTDVVGGAFRLGFASKRWLFRITEAYARLRTALTRVPFGDQAIFLRRDAYERFGGFRDLPIMEDVDLMRRVRKQGGRIVLLPHVVRTSPRRYEEEGVLFCTARNLLLQLLFSLGVPAERLAAWYRPRGQGADRNRGGSTTG